MPTIDTFANDDDRAKVGDLCRNKVQEFLPADAIDLINRVGLCAAAFGNPGKIFDGPGFTCSNDLPANRLVHLANHVYELFNIELRRWVHRIRCRI